MMADPAEDAASPDTWVVDRSEGCTGDGERDFAAFVRAHERGLLAYVRRVAGGLSQAELDPEDVIQETWTHTLVRWPQVAAMGATAPAYVYAIARNEVRRAYRRRAQRAATTAIMPGWTSAGQRGWPVAEQASSNVEQAVVVSDWEDKLVEQLVLERALRELPGQQRAAAVLHHGQGDSAAEVATVLGVTEGTVRAHTRRARAKLRSVLEIAACGVGAAVVVLVYTGAAVVLVLAAALRTLGFEFEMRNAGGSNSNDDVCDLLDGLFGLAAAAAVAAAMRQHLRKRNRNRIGRAGRKLPATPGDATSQDPG